MKALIWAMKLGATGEAESKTKFELKRLWHEINRYAELEPN